MKKIYLAIFLLLFNCISVNAQNNKVESVEPTCENAQEIVKIIKMEARSIGSRLKPGPENTARNTVLASQILGMEKLATIANGFIEKNCSTI